MNVRQFIQFSDLVRAIRRANGLSQRAMAKALDVSPGYIGQWELKLSQPSAQMASKLCQVFNIEDREYVQRLAYAQRAPEWLRDSILRGRDVQAGPMLRPEEQRIIDAIRPLSESEVERLAERVEGWVDAIGGAPDFITSRPHLNPGNGNGNRRAAEHESTGNGAAKH